MEHGVGTLLRDWRTARGLSLGGLALKAGVGKATLSRWEAGASQPRMAELETVLDALRASPAQRLEALACMDAPRAVQRLRSAAAGGPPVRGDLLRALRLRQGWTQEQLAARVEVGQNTIARWERSEDWPSSSHLHGVCFALGARQEEVAVLMTGQFCPGMPEREIGSVEGGHDDLNTIVYLTVGPENEALKDLRFLALEARWWPRAGRQTAVSHLLAAIYAHHAQFLADRNRFMEAQTYVDRALHHAAENARAEWRDPCIEMLAVLISARIAALGGRRDGPAQAVGMLRGWLDDAPTREHKAWLMSDLAHYLALAGNADRGFTLGTQACEATERGEELRMRRRDLARVLLRAGRPDEALSLMAAVRRMDTPELLWEEHPVLLFEDAQLWAEVCLARRDSGAAHDALQEMYSIAAGYSLERLRPRADALARALGLGTRQVQEEIGHGAAASHRSM